jgi:hypothetical protein
MQPTPTQPRVSNGYGYNLNNLGNINFSGLGAGIGDQVAKLRNLIKARGTAAPASNPMTYDYDGDGSIVTYTRQQFDDLYKTNIKRSSLYSGADNGGEGGYFDKLFFMFQLYIAFINALMNAANMSASFIFGNGSLQKLFSVFLVNVLSMILKTNVADLTAEQLRDLLQKNRPVLQQISTIIIDEASQLLVGLSEVCSKIAMDWVQNVIPGLVKSAAIGIPSALEAAIPPLGEVVEIVNTGLALMGSFMKMVGAVQRNVDNVSQGVGHVKSAYDSLQKVRDLLSKDTGEIVKTATSAVVGPALNVAAQNFFTSLSQPPETETMSAAPLETQYPEPQSDTAPPPSSPSHVRNFLNIGKNMVTDAAKNIARQGVKRVAATFAPMPAPVTAPPPSSPSHVRNLLNIGKNVVTDAAKNVARQGVKIVAATFAPMPAPVTAPPPSSPSHVRNFLNIGKNVVTDAAKNVAKQGVKRVSSAISNFLVTPSGTTVNDSNGEPVTKSFWENSWKKLFDFALNKLESSKETMNRIRLNSGSGFGENGKPLASYIIIDYVLKHPDILIPFLPVPYNIAAIAIRLVQTYIERVRQQKAASTASSGGGNRRTETSKAKHRKYLKNTKHFHRYISNLRKKTAKKELELVNSIQELKHM